MKKGWNEKRSGLEELSRLTAEQSSRTLMCRTNQLIRPVLIFRGQRRDADPQSLGRSPETSYRFPASYSASRA
jgi:hypothetical protein